MSEKRYFKVFSERHIIGKQNKYVLLFDALDKCLVENDGELKIVLQRININTDFLSADKNYLYKLILRSLNEFHNSKTFNLELKELLLSIEILFHKGLYHESLKLISKAELLAKECENHQLLLDVLMWKKKCYGYSLGLKKASGANQEISKVVLSINSLKKLTDLYYESNLLQSENEKQSKSIILKKFQIIVNHPILQSKATSLSFSEKIFYHLIYSNYYYAIDDKKKEYSHLQKLVDILNSSKTYSTENPLDYVSIYNRLLGIKKTFNVDSVSFFKDIELLNEFAKKNHIRKEVIVERVLLHTNTHQLDYYLLNNEFQKALNKIQEFENELVNLKIKIEPYHMIYFYYLQATTLVNVGKFHKALKFINKILNEFDFDSRPQVYLRIEVLNAIVHYELKNYSFVITIAKQILKQDLSNNLLEPVEEKILKTLIKICKSSNSSIKEAQESFQIIADFISTSMKEKQLGNLILLENYEKWVLAKIKRKFVSEIYR